jgi:hypothetical protein
MISHKSLKEPVLRFDFEYINNNKNKKVVVGTEEHRQHAEVGIS